MTRVLFLDDMWVRHETFGAKFGDKFDMISHVTTYESCIEHLKFRPAYDEIWLDHDLSDEAILCDPDHITEKTGTDVVNWIATNLDPKTYQCKFVIHSLNPVGALRMGQVLTDNDFSAARYPFSQWWNL